MNTPKVNVGEVTSLKSADSHEAQGATLAFAVQGSTSRKPGDLYLGLMLDIKNRMAVLRRNIENNGKLDWIALEFFYLQIRFILEDIAYSSLCLNTAAAKRLEKLKDFHADRVLKAIENDYGQVFPVPFNNGGDALSREEFTRLYGKCGDMLHGRNPLRAKERDLFDERRQLVVWLNKITHLLGVHKATIVGDPRFFIVHMNFAVDVPPSMATAEILGEGGAVVDAETIVQNFRSPSLARRGRS